MKTRTRKRLTPRTASTINEICALRRDNVGTKHFWILVETGQVVIAEQTSGQPPKWSVSIPKRVFNKFVDFYGGAPQKRR